MIMLMAIVAGAGVTLIFAHELAFVVIVCGFALLASGVVSMFWWAIKRLVRANVEKILDAIENELAAAHGVAPPRPRPPSPKDST
jgi:hypothetical protein